MLIVSFVLIIHQQVKMNRETEENSVAEFAFSERLIFPRVQSKSTEGNP